MTEGEFEDKPICTKCGYDMTAIKWNSDRGALEVHCARCKYAWWMRAKDDTGTEEAIA